MSLDLTPLKRGGCWREARLFYRRRLSVQIFVKRTDGNGAKLRAVWDDFDGDVF